ncbi:MAG: dUTP diphosphatase [Chloroflexota bacterium]|nr:dUTP diphosphatase [Chloroflexota bacterium]
MDAIVLGTTKQTKGHCCCQETMAHCHIKWMGGDKVIIKVKKLRNSAYMPTKGSHYAAGWDLYAAEDTWLTANTAVFVRIGLAVEIPEGYEGQVRPRSGLSGKGVQIVFGTIDSDYRGEVKVGMVYIPSPQRYYYPHIQRYYIKQGDRIAQLVLAPVEKVLWQEVDKLSETERGKGGMGSTGR